MTNNPEQLSIYLHWPFCRSKCPYCDFFSLVKKNINQDEIITEYIQQLKKYAEILPNKTITSVFFGGGTPSLITPKNINKIIQTIDNLWHLSSDTEISLEANPNTQTSSLFSDLKIAGINRLSLGVQSLNDEHLKFLGRTHSSNQALNAINNVLKIFNNHSIDLMYALPNQTLDDWQKQLYQIINLGLKHISLYQLTIEENTPFYRKGIKPLDEEKAADLYIFTETELANHNYFKYEVSNYCQPNFSSRHNLAYWLGHDYIGIGQSAHGRIHKNNKFYAITNPLQFEELTAEQRAEELIIMGLRLTEGINKNNFEQICGMNFDKFINQNFKFQAISQNLLQETKSFIKATPQGFLLLDYLIVGLCS